MKLYWALVAATLTIPTLSNAATFDFTGYSDGIQENLSETDDGLTVNVTAGAYLSNGNVYFEEDQDAAVSIGAVDLLDLAVATRDNCVIATRFGCFIRQDAGIGVALANANVFGDINALQMLTFDFGQVVDFSSVDFGNVDRDDDFDLFIDGSLVMNDRDATSGAFDLTGLSGTSISFGADALFDDFNIQSLSATAVAPVPLPAGALLLGTSLFGFGLYRKKQTS